MPPTDKQSSDRQTDKASVAEVLGIPVAEVYAVADSKAGPVVRTTDGQAYVLTDEGVKFLVKPHPRYKGTFPVFYPGNSADRALSSLGVDLPDIPRDDEDVAAE